MDKIMLATGDESLDEILSDLFGGRWEVSKTGVDLRSHLLPKMEQNLPDLLIVHDKLRSNRDNRDEKDAEWIGMFEHIRSHYPHIRLVFMCVRKDTDLFLLKLINLGIYDLFIDNKIDSEKLVNTLGSPASFANIAKLKSKLTKIESREKVVDEINEDDKEDIPHKEESTKEYKKILASLFNKASGRPTKDKVTQKEKIIEKVVEVNVPTLIEPKLIAVGSLYPGCGSSFISGNVAKMMSVMKIPTGVVEFPTNTPYMYERLYGDEKAPEQWEAWYKQIIDNGKVKKGTEWRDGSIYWVPLDKDHDPKDKKVDDPFSLYTLLASSRQIPVVLVEFSSLNWERESVKQLLNLCDEIWIVTKPHPIQWNIYYDLLERTIQNHSDKTFVVGNYWNAHMKKKEVKKQLEESLRFGCSPNEPIISPKFLATIPQFDGEVNLKSEWEGKFLYEYNEKGLRDSMQKSFEPLLKRLVADQHLKVFKKKGSLLKKLFAFKNKKVSAVESQLNE